MANNNAYVLKPLYGKHISDLMNRVSTLFERDGYCFHHGSESIRRYFEQGLHDPSNTTYVGQVIFSGEMSEGGYVEYDISIQTGNTIDSMNVSHSEAWQAGLSERDETAHVYWCSDWLSGAPTAFNDYSTWWFDEDGYTHYGAPGPIESRRLWIHLTVSQEEWAPASQNTGGVRLFAEVTIGYEFVADNKHVWDSTSGDPDQRPTASLTGFMGLGYYPRSYVDRATDAWMYGFNGGGIINDAWDITFSYAPHYPIIDGTLPQWKGYRDSDPVALDTPVGTNELHNKRCRINAKTIAQLRDILEACGAQGIRRSGRRRIIDDVSQSFEWHVDTHYPISWANSDADNLYFIALGDRTKYGATGGSKYSWTRSIENMVNTRRYDIDIGEIAEIVTWLEDH